MEQGCPHRSILPHIFPDCNSLAIKIGGKFCGVRGVPRWGGLPRRCRRGGRQAGVSGTRRGSLPALSPAYPATVVPAGGVPALSPVNPALTCFPAPYPPAPLPGGKGGIFCFLMQGASPLASPGLNPGGTGSPRRCGKLNGRLASALPARRASGGRQRCPAGGLPALPPANPAFRFLFCPHPPSPLPRWGRGRFFVFLCKGLRPLHPRG